MSVPDNDHGRQRGVPPARAVPKGASRVSAGRRKTCARCAADVTFTARVNDGQGGFFCEKCAAEVDVASVRREATATDRRSVETETADQVFDLAPLPPDRGGGAREADIESVRVSTRIRDPELP